MASKWLTEVGAKPVLVDLVPRLESQGYKPEQIEQRRRWLEVKTACVLRHVGSHSIPGEKMRGNIENPIGAAQVPLGVAGPLRVHGEQARGEFYVPLATTEGALVRSYERGMITLTRAGGVTTRVHVDENCIAPVFLFEDVDAARRFALRLPHDLPALALEVEAKTRHGRLLRIECRPMGRDVIVCLHYSTADAQGMNLIANATERVCKWIMRQYFPRRYYLFSGLCSEKRASGFLFAGGKGKKVVAGAKIPSRLLKGHLHVTPVELFGVWQRTVLGHLQAHAAGYNGHFANGLAALFIACGQDVANVVNSAVGVTHFEVDPDGDLYASVTLPSLTVGTVGGGTGQGTAQECLRMLGCAGGRRAVKFAEIVAATLLAGELSMGAAIASGEFVEAHETYGRNRPDPAADRLEIG
jgi:hydroxymethylglutaryl-CoA reductase (NADPH)